MKVYVIKSDYSDVPLAEVREANSVIEFVVDNTNGKLPARVGKSWLALQQYVRGSSHMRIEGATKATVNLLRYLMTNGDVVEITSDGHTVILNGNLLSQEEKDALFVAFQRGDIKVARQTPISQAVPVLPTKPKIEQSREKPKYDPDVMRNIQASQAKEAQAKAMSGPDYDHEIEEADLSGAEDPEWTKRLMYWLKWQK